MASTGHNEELLPEQTEGYKVGEKRTLDEYHKMGMLISPWHFEAAIMLDLCPSIYLFLLFMCACLLLVGPHS
jgi:hypothetical protein